MNSLARSVGIFSVLTVAAIAGQSHSMGSGKAAFLMYVGTYTKQGSKGIYAYRFEPGTGKLTPVGLVAETESPSFVALHPNRRFLYAVNEIANYEGGNAGSVSSFSLDPNTGKLTFINKVSTRGAGPCHLVVDKTGKCLLVANYDGGSVAAFPVKDDGSLGKASAFVQHRGVEGGPKKQVPHAHMVQLSADNRFTLVPDLGLDEVITYRLDPAKAALTAEGAPAKVTSGLGPRHLAFHPTGSFDYLINETGSAVTVFRYEAAHGALSSLQTISTLPKGFTGSNDTAEIEVHPNGKFLYASNRGHDSIAVFGIDSAKGTLTPIQHMPTQGKTPRNFAIDPTGTYLFAANQDSGNIVPFRIDTQTGRLTPTQGEVKIPQPVCLIFLPLH